MAQSRFHRESEGSAGVPPSDSHDRSPDGAWKSPVGAIALLAFTLLFTLQPGALRAEPVPQGHPVLNVATISADEFSAVAASAPATVRVRRPSPAQIELFQFAPAAPGGIREAVARSAFRRGAGETDPLVDLPLPMVTGTTTPISLAEGVPLLHASQYHAGDPVFIRVTDLDRNQDWTVRDTILVKVTNDLTSDSEVVRLTEDGGDTGTFVGYLPSSLPPTTPAHAAAITPATRFFDGVLEVVEGSIITARYVDPFDARDDVRASAIVDPATRVFDSQTGKSIDGAEVTLIDVATGNPAQVMGDDGASSFPATLKSGGEASDASGRVYHFARGSIRFPWVKTGEYRYVVKAPVGYSVPSVVSDAALQALPGAPFAIVTPGSRGEPFRLNPGPGFRIDIPMDPTATTLWVQKTAGKDRVGVGDYLPYDITVSNLSTSVAAQGTQIVDTLPVGFRYQRGSTQVNGVTAADPAQSKDGRVLTFDVGVLAPGATIVIRIVVLVGPATTIGVEAINLATAKADGGSTANVARAAVKVGDDFLTTRSVLMGRVSTGECGPPPPPPAPAPPPKVVAPEPVAVAPPPPREPPKPGQLGLQLRQQLGETTGSYSVDLWGQSAPLNDFRVAIELPRGMNYEPGSCALDGAKIQDPAIEGTLLSIRMPDQAAGNWKSLVTFRTYLAAGAKLKDAHVTAAATAKGPSGAPVSTGKSVAPVTLAPRVNHKAVNLTLRPHFESLGTRFSDADRAELDAIAVSLRKAHVDRIAIVGHTDSDQIKGRGLKKFKNNYDLSLARARSVGEYLTKALHFPADKMSFDGKGEDQPIADNETSEGRAMNRRVEVRASAAEQTSELLLSEGDGAPPVPVTAVVAAALEEPQVVAAAPPPVAPTATTAMAVQSATVVTATSGMEGTSANATAAGAVLPAGGSLPTFTNESQDGLDDGVAGVRILMEDGTYVTTDRRGLFHFDGVAPGLHVVQLDLDSLPEGYEAISCKTHDRFAGRAFSQFVEIGGGVLWRADFLVHPKPVAPPPPPPPPPPVAAPKPPPPPRAPVKAIPGDLALHLIQKLDGLGATYVADVSGTVTPFEGVVVTIELPANLVYTPGSATLDGATAEVRLDDSTMIFKLGQRAADWKNKIAFSATIAEGSRPGTRIVFARASGVDPTGATVTTPPAETVLRVGQEGGTKPIKLVIRPHFPVLSADLSDEDKKEIDAAAETLRTLNLKKIVVTGHTDSDKIKGRRAQKLFKDNAALSLARATSVGRYLMEFLHVPADKIEFVGKGEAEPVEDNATAEGRAHNRRVEVLASAVQTTMHTAVVSLSDDSGVQQVATANVAPVEPAPEAVAQSEAAVAPSATATAPAAASGAAQAGTTTAMATGTGATTEAAATTTGATVTTAATATTATAPVPAPRKRPEDGLLSPVDGEAVADRINAVQVRLKSWLKPHLSIDGKEVNEDRIGFRSEDPKTGKTNYTYVGVDFGEKGAHLLSVWGVDPFGNKRNEQTVRILRTGDIASIRLVSTDGNTADSRTPVRVRVELVDATGDVIHASARLEIREGNLTPPRKTGLNLTVEEEATGRIVMVDKEGWVAFAPVPTSGSFHVLLAAGNATLPVDVWVKPDMRDWVLVGLAEGTLGYDIVKGNMETAAAADVPENLYADGRVAFYGKGQIKGQWLVTVAYDTRQPTGNATNSLFQVIDPQTYFTLYGDSSQQQYDAASSRKLYVKIERDQFYALFGDFDSGLTMTELSRYGRRMNGIKAEVQTNVVEANAFGTQTDRLYTQDRLQGDGTSGLYHLTKRNITLNSDKITLEVRDRFRSEVIVSTRTMTRFIDYSIDYDSGTLFFSQPIPSRDEHFNPIFIVAEYEMPSTGKADFTYGGRAGLKLLDQRLKIGASAIHEGQDTRQNNLLGADLKIEIVKNLQLRGEFAWTNSLASGAAVSGRAWLTELAYTSQSFDGKLYYRTQERGFGLGQQSTTEDGTRKVGAEAGYRFGERLSLTGQVYDQYLLNTKAERILGEARLNYAPRIWGGYVGVLNATDRLAGGETHTSGQITAGVKWLTLSDQLIFTVDHAQQVYGNGNTDFPTRTTLGVEYKILPTLSLLGAQEFTWGKTAITTNTRLGLRSNLWKGSSLTTSVDREMNENAWRIFGNIGLRQSWQVSEAWKIDAGGERSQTIKQEGWYQFNPNVPPTSGATEDFTALSAGATYQLKGLVWDNRAEGRFAKSETKWGFISGVVGEPGNGWAWSARAQYLGSVAPVDQRADTASGRLGLVFRPAHTNWILLNRLDFILDRKSHTSADVDSWRVVENLLANWKPVEQVQMSFGYGGKYAHERISGKVYEGYTHQATVEARVDVTSFLDVGLRGSVLHSWRGGQVSGSVGPSVGVSVVENTWLGVGYNLWGYDDPDLSASNYTAQGPYIRLRVKFDQLTLPGVAAWLNKQ